MSESDCIYTHVYDTNPAIGCKYCTIETPLKILAEQMSGRVSRSYLSERIFLLQLY